MDSRQEGMRWIREQLAWEVRLAELRELASMQHQAAEGEGDASA